MANARNATNEFGGRMILCQLMLTGLSLFVVAPEKSSPKELIDHAVGELIKMQEAEGQWPYEGVYRVKGEIPVGYQIGGTAIVGTALLYAASENKDAQAAVQKGAAFILKALEHPLMLPSTQDAYDVRVWGHGFALDFFCHLRANKALGNQEKEIQAWIPKLVKILIEEEIDGGGWNYANRKAHASFVTAPIVQALLLARSQGETVPEEVLARATKALLGSQLADGNFLYSGLMGKSKKPSNPARNLPGSIARGPGSETTLMLLGAGSLQAIQNSINAFHEHWDELEKRRKKTGTHEGAYAIAPYYFYYGHRYAAQAIEMLPEAARQKERDRLLKTILKTRDPDGTWNDRVFERSRNFGTSMIVLGLLRERTPVPAALEKAK